MICPRCKSEAGDSNYCPNCGTDLTHVGRVHQDEDGRRVIYNRNAPPPKRHGCLIVILTLLFLFLAFCFLVFIFSPRPDAPYMDDDWEDSNCEDGNTWEGPTHDELPSTAEEDLVTITMEEYNQIEVGMTYEEVQKIVGGDGENISSADFGIGDGPLMEIYTWDSAEDGYGSATIMVEDGIVISKFQYGLEQ